MSKRAIIHCNATLQLRTAAAWAKRAIAAYRRAANAARRRRLADCGYAILEAEDHRHEALEHAALVGDYGRTVAKVQKQVDAWRVRVNALRVK